MAAGRKQRRTPVPPRRSPAEVARRAAEKARLATLERRRTIAIWLMLLSVLAWVPGGFSRFVVAKLLVIALACLVAATVPRLGRLPRDVAVLLGIGATVFVMAALVGETPVASLLGRWPRYEGLPVLGMYAASAWLGARLIGPGGLRLGTLVSATAGMSITLCLFSALDAIGLSPLGDSRLTRDGSLLGNATDQGLVAMMAVAVLARPALEERRTSSLVGLAAALFTVALSGSRASMLLTVVVVLALALAGSRRLLLPAVAGVVLLVLAVLAVPQSRERLTNADTVRGRWLQWRLTGDMVSDHPWLGWGPSRYLDVFGGYETAEYVDWAGTRTTADSPHDIVLQVLVAGGIPLLLCFLALVVVTARRGLLAVREQPELAGLLAAVAAYAVAMLANFTVASSTCLAAFLAGALIAERPAAVEPRIRQVAAATVAGLAVLVLVLGCASEVLLQRGMVAAADDRRDDARSAFDSARMLRPGDGDTAMLAAQSMAALASRATDVEAAADADELARASLDRTPETYQSRVALGVALMTRDELTEARRVLDAAVTQSPYRPGAYLQRGIVRFGQRDVTGARRDLRRALDLAPHDRRPRQVLREIRRRLAG